MDIPVFDQQSGESSERLELNDDVFAARYNAALVHQVVTAYFAASRAGTRAHRSRAEVSGGNAKPWRQKGTGRARAGSSRSPLWRGGGKTFASRPTSYAQKVNRKMYRGAMRSILSELLRLERLKVVKELSVEAPKTRQFVERMRTLGVDDVLVVTQSDDQNLYLAGRNLPGVALQASVEVSPVSLLAFENVLFTPEALKDLEARVA